MATIELRKEQEVLASRIYNDTKAFTRCVYGTMRGLIYWTNEGVRLFVIWHAITLYLVGVGATAYAVHLHVLKGKPFIFDMETAGDVQPTNLEALDAAIMGDLKLEQKAAQKWKR